MNKFSQLADDIEADLLGLDKDADELNERRLAIKERARVATNAHHATYDSVEGGLKKLEDAAAGLGGRKNSKDETKAGESQGKEVSGGTSEAFHPKTPEERVAEAE